MEPDVIIQYESSVQQYSLHPRPSKSLHESIADFFFSIQIAAAVTPVTMGRSAEGTASWKELVEAYVLEASASVCMIVLDDSRESNSLREVIKQRYADIDRISGDKLIVLTTVAPPTTWRTRRVNLRDKLPQWARQFENSEISEVISRETEADAKFNSLEIFSKFFEGNLAAPILVFLAIEQSTTGDSELKGTAYPLVGLVSEQAFIGALEFLSKLASSRQSTDSINLGEIAYSPWNPRSLRWRNSAHATLRIFDFVHEFTQKVKMLP
jgi:hypothetical protein